jgi:hypothetical protein
LSESGRIGFSRYPESEGMLALDAIIVLDFDGSTDFIDHNIFVEDQIDEPEISLRNKIAETARSIIRFT